MTTRFELHDLTGWSEFLHTHGYAVIKSVITKEQAAEALDEMWALMEALSPVRKDRPKTHRLGKNWPSMLHGGMVQYIGHAPLQWRLRELCATVYARYYDTEATNLATSFDGLCMMHSARKYQRGGELLSFMHTDQSPRRKEEWSIQGLINLADAGPDDGGLVVIPGTHTEHQAFFTGHPRGDQKSDWYKLTDVEKNRYRDRVIKVCAEPGDFLLWDSRTFHANTVPVRPGAIRACTYICMLPQERISKHIRYNRQKAWNERRTSSHHPGDGFRMFPTLPRFVTDRDRFLATVRTQMQPTLTDAQTALLCGTGQQTLVR
ncbi:MAG: ectoine hydroxylase-related dioxygenase (phytanoyl-CoA dioxygenase family) [Myxococcota bacterium]|jgi:ectoine hydroxylase-related dioxygenase (phytanoyl-CoA dioxygenase family)